MMNVIQIQIRYGALNWVLQPMFGKSAFYEVATRLHQPSPECGKARTATALVVETRLICDGSKWFRGHNSVLCAPMSRSGSRRRIGSLIWSRNHDVFRCGRDELDVDRECATLSGVSMLQHLGELRGMVHTAL